MAASLLQNPTPPSSRPTSRQRHHDRRPSEKSQRYERELRRLQSEQRHGEQQQQQQGRMPSPRQKTRGWQQPTPPDTPGSSSASLTAPLEDHTRSLPMERTSSGNSIVADQNYEPRHNYTLTCSDADAARSVQYSTKSPKSDEKFVRYFRKLIESHDELDDNALDSILIGTDTVFFHGALSGRVRWEWSHPSQSRYESELIGSTALRPATSPALKGGYETLIVLSAPILRHNSRRFDRRLLLSAFLHELVHCYLFIQCGFLARDQGGHTEGFHIIAGVIDDWVAGCGVVLKLCNMKANLNHFRVDRPVVDATRTPGGRFLSPGAFLRDRDGANVGWQHRHEGCSHSPGDRSHEETGILWQAREEGWR